MREQKLLINAEGAAEMLDVGKSLFYEMNSSGRLGPMPIRLGRKTLWRTSELQRWVESGCPGRKQWQGKDGQE